MEPEFTLDSAESVPQKKQPPPMPKQRPVHLPIGYHLNESAERPAYARKVTSGCQLLPDMLRVTIHNPPRPWSEE